VPPSASASASPWSAVSGLRIAHADAYADADGPDRNGRANF
jgi:hypothetical protein